MDQSKFLNVSVTLLKEVAKGLIGVTIPFDVTAILKSSEDIDERITKLSAVQADLEAAVDAVKSLRHEADRSKAESDRLKSDIQALQQDKSAAEEITRVPEEAFIRLYNRARDTGKWRGWLEGGVGGFVVGLLTNFAYGWLMG